MKITGGVAMAVRDNTKYAFANAIKKLLQNKDLNQIRITELCALCGAERPTFYYHFRDKYDLIAWIYLKDLELSVTRNNGIYDRQQLANLLHILRSKSSFYKKVFEEQAQNALSNYIYEYNVRNTIHLIRGKMKQEEISREMEFSVRFFASAWVSCMVQWILNPSGETPEELADLIYQNLPPILANTYSGHLPFEP